MYNSQTASHGINPSFGVAFMNEKEELLRIREAMASDLCHQQQLNSSLMRFRSAPSSLLANFIESAGDGCECEDFLPRSSSPEADSMFATYINCGSGESASADALEIGEKPSSVSQRNPEFMTGIEQEAGVVPQPKEFHSSLQTMFQTTSQPNRSSANVSGYEISYQNSLPTDTDQEKSRSNSYNLIRHSSSPAGLFSHLTSENGPGVMRGMSSSSGGNGINGQAIASSSRFKNHISLLSRQASSPVQMSPISEMGAESLGESNPDDGNFVKGNGTGGAFIPGRIPVSSWDEPSLDKFSGLKRFRNSNGPNTISNIHPSATQMNGETGKLLPGLTHQFSLPKTSSEMAAMEKFLQFQDSVPCKVRAKRGCATHPRSIAERVRRTRISERMRKLQELVPNMDKQTNTADMLDLAVDYIKDLQRQVKVLSDGRESCICPDKQKPYNNPAV